MELAMLRFRTRRNIDSSIMFLRNSDAGLWAMQNHQPWTQSISIEAFKEFGYSHPSVQPQ
jgi:hypothetical protein